MNMAYARSRLEKYGRTPRALLRNGTISGEAKALYAMVDEVADHEPLAMKRLASWCGKTENTVRKYMAELVAAGWVEVIHRSDDRGQLPNIYIANDTPFSTREITRPVDPPPSVSDSPPFR